VTLLTLARDLRRRKARERQRLFVAEGVRAVEELLAAPLRVRGALATERLDETPRGAALRAALLHRGILVDDVSPRDFESAADTDTPQGVLAIAECPAYRLEDIASRARLRVLVLDALQDPGNVGTILRTAAAFGVDATVALAGTVDLWNAKVVRSAMGAHFRHPAMHCTWDELSSFLERGAIPLWAADAGGTPLGELAPPPRLAVAVGYEGAGLTCDVAGAAAQRVSLPIAPDVESLNVAVAAGVLLYELRA
jgi:TrmH family RNA methyltransferase